MTGDTQYVTHDKWHMTHFFLCVSASIPQCQKISVSLVCGIFLDLTFLHWHNQERCWYTRSREDDYIAGPVPWSYKLWLKLYLKKISWYQAARKPPIFHFLLLNNLNNILAPRQFKLALVVQRDGSWIWKGETIIWSKTLFFFDNF